ncbi:MAG: hypothetical protein K0S65_6580 [Labilithrix sp.]|nr:hypothetical protein [Labilithrix sp.]
MSNAKQVYTHDLSLHRTRSTSQRFTRPMRWAPQVAAGLALLAAIAACTPEIGDKCQVSTDCSVQGDRLCDTSQPGGYCTQLNCQGNSCFDEASCVLFGSAIPGCGFDDRSGRYGSRVARSFCMAKCESNGDCREGYVCADPTKYPWNAVILDDNQSKRSCLAIPLEGQDAGADAGNPDAGPCNATAPDAGRIEASAPSRDGGIPPLFPKISDAATDGG